MKISFIILAIISSASSAFLLNKYTSVNGGTNCFDCTVIVGLIEQLGIVYNQTAEKSLEQLCGFLPQGIFRSTCQMAVKEYGPVIING
jgi:hypothetical protein